MFKIDLKKQWGLFISTIKRFPIAYLSAAVATVCIMVFVQLEFDKFNPEDEFMWLIKLALTATFGFVMYYTVYLLGETKKLKKKWLWLTGLTGLLALIYVFQYQYFDWDIGLTKTIVRTFLGLFTVYLAALALPFFGLKTKENAFWQYSQRFETRIAQAFVVFGLLFGGIAATLATIDALFNLHISGIVYQQIFIALAGFGSTIFVMSGVDAKLNDLAKVKDYPKFYETLNKYVLIPLIYIYAAVVYAYLVKILVEFQWPKHGVAELISGFLIVGFVTYFLSFPDKGKNTWIGKFYKYFLPLALPVAIVLIVGIGVRIDQFGFTVNRYLILVFGAYVVGLSLWKLIKRNLDIRNIIYSAVVVSLLLMYGPVSAFSVTWMSQTDRLEELINQEDANGYEVSGIVRTLSNTAYAPRVESYLNDLTQNNQFSIDEDTYSYSLGEEFIEVVGIEANPFNPYSRDHGIADRYFNVNVSQPIQQVDLEDYNYLLKFDHWNGSDKQPYLVNDQKLQFELDGSTVSLTNYFERDLTDFFNLFVDKRFHELPRQDIEIRDENYLIQFEEISGSNEDGQAEVNTVSGYILIK